MALAYEVGYSLASMEGSALARMTMSALIGVSASERGADGMDASMRVVA